MSTHDARLLSALLSSAGALLRAPAACRDADQLTELADAMHVHALRVGGPAASAVTMAADLLVDALDSGRELLPRREATAALARALRFVGRNSPALV